MAALLLFAAVLVLGAPSAEAALPRPADVVALNAASHGPETSAAIRLGTDHVAAAGIDAPDNTPRLGFAEDLCLLEPDHAQAGFGLFERGTRRCERTYARNNPLRFMDRTGLAPQEVTTKDGVQGAAAGVGPMVLNDSVVRVRVYDSPAHRLEQLERGLRESYKYQARGRMSPIGQALSEAHYPSWPRLLLDERLLTHANATNPGFDKAAKLGIGVGSGLTLLSIGMASYTVAVAPEGERLDTAERQGKSLLGGASGSLLLGRAALGLGGGPLTVGLFTVVGGFLGGNLDAFLPSGSQGSQPCANDDAACNARQEYLRRTQ